MQLYLDVIVSGVLVGCVYALIATGLTLVFGVMRVVNIAHGETVVIGMYIGYWCFELFGLPPLVSAPIAAALLFVFGYLMQQFLVARVLREPLHVQFLLYIGLALAITGLQAILFGPNGRSILSGGSFSVYEFVGVRLDGAKTQAGGAALVLMAALWLFLRYSRLGKSIRACASNHTGAEIVGIRIDRVFAVTAGIGAACAGAAGALIAALFDTHPFLGNEFTLLAFVVVTLGGLGSFPGALLGGLLIGVSEGLAAVLTQPSIKSLFSYGLLILILLLRPYGIFGRRDVS
ncbi:MAG: branched-chain amino acid ABC transporter permease [Betaproteobacteria bacterium]|nr:branched-chain amino acid ABC transporter permease [Betaproteobacteria bacterium]